MTRRRFIAAASTPILVLIAWWAVGRNHKAATAVPPRLTDREFRELVDGFSEPDGVFRPSGAFRSDNLISNERSLQDVVPDLATGPGAGAYLGVGPEQNFTYVIALRPTIAFIVDIRRQNMLLHLMYKALIEMSSNRADFLSRLFAREPIRTPDRTAKVDVLLGAFTRVERLEPLARSTADSIIARLEKTPPATLTSQDRDTIRKIYSEFASDGPQIRWDPDGGPWIPTYVDLMTGVDNAGAQHSFLASEDAFQLLKQYEIDNRIVPLVGDFGGDKTIRRVARYLKDHNDTVAAFYTSNVEGYLRGDSWTKFVLNVGALPVTPQSLFIRTTFMTTGYTAAGPEFKTRTILRSIQPWLEMFAVAERSSLSTRSTRP